MDFLIVLFVLPAIATLSVLATRAPGGLAGLGPHPYNVLGLLLAVVATDFLVLSVDVRTTFVQSVFNYRVTSSDEVVSGAFFFLMCSAALVAGVAVATAVFNRGNAKKVNDEPVQSNDKTATALIALIMATSLFILSFYILATSMASGSILYVASTRSLFFRENQFVYTLILMTAPTFMLFGSRFGLTRVTYVYALLMLACLPLVGSRSLMIYTLAALGFWMSRKIKLGLAHLYLALPVVGVLSVIYRYIARESHRYADLSHFLDTHGGFFGVLFRTPDISFAELITIGVNNRIVERDWADTLLGAIFAPIPRSIIPWKPEGASSDFTNYTNADFFEITGSAKTVTGFVDIYLSSNYIIAPLIIGVLGFIWAALWMRAQSSKIKSSFIGPILMVAAYLFIRSDVYNLALFVWPLLFVLALKWVIALFLRTRNPRRRKVTLRAVRSRM